LEGFEVVSEGGPNQYEIADQEHNQEGNKNPCGYTDEGRREVSDIRQNRQISDGGPSGQKKSQRKNRQEVNEIS